uniref:Uncharacterized protein n=1 Tax=Anguilla anguilla TaxID=7936 RepID=A0A0E9UID6_ANGAN
MNPVGYSSCFFVLLHLHHCSSYLATKHATGT